MSKKLVLKKNIKLSMGQELIGLSFSLILADHFPNLNNFRNMVKCHPFRLSNKI